MNERLDRAQREEWLEPADRHLARHLLELAPRGNGELELLIALASAAIRRGHVCLSLEDNPELEALGVKVSRETLARSGIVGRRAEEAPLVLDGDRFYLARYHAWEQQVIHALRQRLEQPAPKLDRKRLKAGLEELFDHAPGRINWQRVAAALAVIRTFCVISGGPGTGKTWTVARILKLLLGQPGGDSLRIGLAAPTGKAAARMTESIGEADPGLLEKLEPAQTLHRLLGMRPGRVRPKHHTGHPLALDLLILDEMSMVDLPMMARLLQALPMQARLILLGDRHQLASVEAGQVMADLCGPGELAWSEGLAEEIRTLTGEEVPVAGGLPPMAGHRVELRGSRRFDPDRGIGRLARAVNEGDADATRVALREGGEEVRWLSAGPEVLRQLLREQVVPLFREIRECGDPGQALGKMEQVRVLCAVREGPQGVRRLNALVERALGVDARGFYAGQPVMVVVNDYEQSLFNGDVGVMLPDQEGRLRAWFPRGSTDVRPVLPGRLPAHETVYAMTIHKSQGSEFERVLLVLPEEESPVVTRELLYTGITRARRQVLLCASEASLERALARRVRRASGLREALWPDSDSEGSAMS